MNVNEFQKWVKAYYKTRGWSGFGIFILIEFLTEETREVARARASIRDW